MFNYSFFVISSLSLLLLFILNLIVGMYRGYGDRHYWFFQLEHVLGGFFVAMFFISFTDSWTLVLVGLAIVTIIWESLEIAVARIQVWSKFLKRKLKLKKLEYSWADGLFDVVCNYAGALVFLHLFK